MSTAPVPSDEEFKAAFSLLPKVLNLLKKLSTVQGDQQKQIQAAVCIINFIIVNKTGMTVIARVFVHVGGRAKGSATTLSYSS